MGNSNSATNRIPVDLLEEIFLLLPVESILSCRCVSKHWRSILESKEFLERRKNRDQKSHLKLLVADMCDCIRPPRLLPESSRLQGEEELVYLHCNFGRDWMTCDGLVCLPCYPDPDLIHVLNPSTRQLRRFPVGVDKTDLERSYVGGSWLMGFGRDKVTDSYKVVKICPSSQPGEGKECSILSVETGEWLKLSPLLSYMHKLRTKSVCVNGSIYWLYSRMERDKILVKLLALDLHKQDFHDVSVPATWITTRTQLANLEDRLVMAQTKGVGLEWMLEIMTMDAEEETWSKTFSISLAHTSLSPTTNRRPTSFRPVAFSQQRDLVLYNNNRTLLKYNPETHEIRCLSAKTYLLAPYLENLVPLPLLSNHSVPLDLGSVYWTFTPNCPFFDPRPWTSKTDDLITTLLTICVCILVFFYGL